MAVYQAGIKGLFTESNPQDTPPETMLDCQDVVISRDNLAESRHGANTQKITRASGNWNNSFSIASSKLSVLKVNFDTTVSGNVRKYVLLSSGSNGMQELNTATDLTNTITTNLSSIPTTYTSKPIGFTFDQSLYIITASGWQEMQKDVLDSGASGVKKLIQWPTFKDVVVSTQVNTIDPANNWVPPNKKCGIRLTYVLNARYTKELPREVESYPSGIYEMRYAQPTSALTNASTINSFIRIGISASSYTGFTTGINNREYFLRIYRTKLVDIEEALPTEYFQAYADISLIDSPTSFDLTVNDNGIVTLPGLYTNPNLDGEVNSNTVPPIVESVIEYKNYFVAANIREPLRAYITMINPPYVTNRQFLKNIGAAAVTNATFNTFTADSTYWSVGDIPAFSGSPTNTYSLYSFFWPSGTNITSTIWSNATNAISVADNSKPYTLTGASGSDVRIYFDGTIAQTNAALQFRFTDSTGAVTSLTPSAITPIFNRPGYYSNSDDKGLQFSGPTFDQFRLKTTYALLRQSPYTTNAANINSNLRISMSPGTSNGFVQPSISSTSNSAGSVITVGADSVTFALNSATDGVINIGDFPEPGIFYVEYNSGGPSLNTAMFSYKTVSVPGANQIKFEGISKNSPGAFITTSSVFYNAYAIPGSTAKALPIYLRELTSVDTLNFNLTAGTYSNIPHLNVSFLPVIGAYPEPIGVVDASKMIHQNGNTMLEGTLFGNLTLSPAQILDLTVTDLVNKCNSANTNNDIRFIKTENAGEFLVEYYGGNKIEAAIASGGTHSYDPELTLSYQTVAEYKKNNQRALSISRYNSPESFPNSSVLAPILVGSDKAAIVALAKNSNDCFILKEDGIWRLSITGNSSLALVDEVTQLDTTTYCQAPYSVQEINEEVIFLSQKGFISINGNQIDAIGRAIETEVKEKLQRSIANGLQNEIRSWVNEEKRIYGCTIRDTAATYTTYVLNTYTRNWTKFSLPVIDATTDSQGRTLYAIGMPELDLGTGDTLQDELESASSGSTTNFYLTEEVHTQGLFRNEEDQWDYRYIPASVALGTGNQVVLTDNSATLLPNWVRLGGVGTDITTSGLSFFVSRGAYYQKSNVIYPCTFVSRTATTCTIEFTDGVPANITTVSGDDGLYAGVPASITFNPSNLGAPNTNKVFSEYQLHTVEAVSSLTMQFITDSRADYTTPRVFAFNRDATSRTVYRSYIPVEACRGRWLIRKVTHDVPLERLQSASQSLTVRDTQSSRVQKSPR